MARHKIMLWRIAWNLLPLKHTLASHNFSIDPNCTLCDAMPETSTHLFLNCNITRLIWTLSIFGCRPPSCSDDPISWLNIMLKIPNFEKENQSRYIIFAASLMELVWFARNKLIHEKRSIDPLSLARKINTMALDKWAALANSNSLKIVNNIWNAPPLGWHKINFDAAIRGSQACAAIVCRDHLGECKYGITELIKTGNAEVAEASAALLAIRSAIQCKTEYVIFEGDAEVIINSLQGSNLNENWRTKPILEEAKALLMRVNCWNLSVIPRCANSRAHKLAAVAFQCNFFDFVPSSSNLLSNLEEA